MILSASGWRKIFAESGNGEDSTPNIGETNRLLCTLIGETFAQYIISKTGKKKPEVVVARDTRPTGAKIAQCILSALVHYDFKVQYLEVASAPEIMAYAKSSDGFLYISASHNPIGHNGIKFGLSDGGVLEGKEAKILIDNFKEKCLAMNAKEHAEELLSGKEKKVSEILQKSPKYKEKSLEAYSDFIKTVITGENGKREQDKILNLLKDSIEENPITIVCDMNGSARCLSIDESFLGDMNLYMHTFNNVAGQIKHAIIPEPENLVHCANKMQELQADGLKNAILGYMPDCDGDRGNIVYWNEKDKKAYCIQAQEVFALSVLAENAYDAWKSNFLNNGKTTKKTAVAVNCPTSMRIEEICSAFETEVFRAEVGEANVVNLAREKRAEGYSVRILGEGSNGGNITYPSSVRDPIATIFALLKLLTIRDAIQKDGTMSDGLFHMWCRKSGQEKKYRPDFTLSDIIATLPNYTTTGVSESRALLKVETQDKGKLKTRFQKIFENEWKAKKDELLEKYGIASYSGCITNGTKETVDATDWNNANGGLKVKFMDTNGTPCAFIWMRPSGTEPVFRVMCDVKGNRPQEEKSLLEWETYMIQKADKI